MSTDDHSPAECLQNCPALCPLLFCPVQCHQDSLWETSHIPLCHSKLFQTNLHTRWTVNQIKESASVKNKVITPCPSTGPVPCSWVVQGAAEGGGKGRLSPGLLWKCCSFPLLGTCCFHRNQFPELLLEDEEVKFCSLVILLCFLTSFIFWSLLMGYFCPFLFALPW